MKPKEQPTVRTKIPRDLYDKVKKKSESEGRTMCGLIRLLLTNYVK